jgi:AcrR family transcriptional regulator
MSTIFVPNGKIISMNTSVLKKRGRPIEFDKDQALDNALHLFWAKGYEGTSLGDLVDTLGINKPSLYASFGNKEELFHKVLERYTQGPASFLAKALQEKTSKDVAIKFLTEAADVLTSKNNPKGCLIIQSALSCSDESISIKKLLTQYRKNIEGLLKNRFDRSKKDGDLPKTTNTEFLAKYIITIHQGMSVQATNGTSKKELLEMIKIAMNAWPH